mgnify:FL=1
MSKTNKKSVISSLFVASLLSTSFIAPTLIPYSISANSSSAAQAAPRARRTPLQITPQKRSYSRGEEIQLTGKSSPNAPVEIIQMYKHQYTGRRVREVLSNTQANSQGIVNFRYRIPLEEFKDNIRIAFRSQGRSQRVRIPLGRPTPPPNPQPPNNPPQTPIAPRPVTKPELQFPLTISSPETKVKSKSYMQSDVTLSTTPSGGLLYSKTRIWSRNKWNGFTGGVEVVLLDENDNFLFISQLHKYGVNGRYIPGAPDSRTETWNETIPADVMKRARKIAIYHRHTPKSRLTELFSDMKKLVDFVKPVVQLLS